MTDKTYPAELEQAWDLETQLVRGGLRRSGFGETSEALFLNSGFVYDNAEAAEARFKGEAEGFMYSRYGNPTVAAFEDRMKLMERAEDCFATASGMSAVFTSLLATTKAGDHVIASRALFGSCHHIITQLLPRYGIETTLVDGPDLAQWRAALRPNTTAAFIETPANPTLELIDIAGVAEIVHSKGAKLLVDNVFATPLLQRPLELGADVVIYSATKHIDGQGRCMGGVILSDKAFIREKVEPLMRHTGPTLSAFNAWVLLKGLETLPLRVERHCQSALAVAQALEAEPKVKRVLYPGLPSHPQYDLAQKQMGGGSSLIAFEVAGGKAEAFALMNALGLIDISNNLGDSKSLITHPATTTHRAMGEEGRAAIGVGDGLIRLSVGLESPADLIADLHQALGLAEAA